MKYFYLFLLSVMTIFATSCGDETDRYELVSKLRSLGIRSSQPIVTGASTIDLEIFALVPKDQLITGTEVFVDSSVPKGFALSLQLKEGESYEEYGALKLYRKEASLVVPPVDQAILAKFNGVARFRYGVKLSAGDEEDIIIGDVLSVSQDSESLQWTPSALSLVAPKTETPISMPFNLDATLNRTQDERVKISWLVSSGQVKNRVGLKTLWENSEKGTQTVVVAAYSTKSRFFSYEIRQVTVE